MEMNIVKKLFVMVILALAISASAFGFGIELGAGANVINVFGRIVPIPSAGGGVIVPVMGSFSLTGQFDALFEVGYSSDSPAYMALGGGRYTFDMKNMKIFIGADGGALMNFFTPTTNLIFGVNAGISFGMFYIKGAMRWLNITYSDGETTAPQTKLFPVTEIMGGLYLEF